LKGHGNQFEQHAICPAKHKCKSKMQNLPYQQTKHNDLIGLQTPFQWLKNLFQHPKGLQYFSFTNVS
jgi:hypothetical protein